MADKVIRQNHKGEWIKTPPELTDNTKERLYAKSLKDIPKIKRLVKEIGE